jgi:hypothetical protein
VPLRILPALLLLAAIPAAAQTAGIEVRADPRAPLIERTAFGQAVNFDFRVANRGADPVELKVVHAVVKDARGQILAVIEVNDNGSAPGILTVPQRTVAPGAALTLFNPVHTLPREIAVDSIDFRLTFAGKDDSRVETRLTVRPRVYAQKTRLVFPLGGRVLVWDGHDFLSHHRRVDLDHPILAQVGIATNASRYSSDLVAADAGGAFFRGDGKAHGDHYVFGQPVLAPGDGIVVLVENGMADGGQVSLDTIKANPIALFGNHVVIDHGNGEFSRLGHLRQGSVRVAKGQRVRAGEAIALVGTSGTSLFPHLHYELGTTADLSGEGLPVHFADLDRLLGDRRVPMADRGPDSGEIVEKR